ncbi:hypothetical protein Psi02_31350 [Planotetraspora silvatica]|uniref:Uncharacterized protein n=1 Tax=Planotetraspora silvatica TaxID=234614 RepID=A0A8J3UNX1_9ACTN|nr:hypothetical protein [Planotetraspora silvatica]GII46711.1 hypothetical protein Psi02_31350 [Planotetraspora silvatica]
MKTLTLHPMVETLNPEDSRTLTLLILTIMITLVVAAIRWMVRRTRVVLMISGSGILLVVLTILITAYLVAYGTI